MDMNAEETELMKLNYGNLHNSVWNSHNVSWIGTSIFIPILFTLLGYLVKELSALSMSQVWMAFALTELLVVSWWLMMRILRHYNDIRIDRLREIEGALDKIIGSNVHLLRQYRLPYRLNARQRIRKLAISPMKIYTALLVGYTVVNIALVCTKYLST